MSDYFGNNKDKQKKLFSVIRAICVCAIVLIVTTCLLSVNSYAKTTKLKAPTNITVSASTTSATLKWSKVSGAKSYNVYMYNSNTKKYALKKTTAKMSYSVKGLKSYTWYRFVVKASKNTNGYQAGTSSKVIKIRTKAVKLAAPSKISASKSINAVKLKWSKVKNAKAYNVYMYNETNKKYVLKKTLTGTSYTFSKLKAYTSYKFIIKAAFEKNGKQPGVSSKTVAVRTNEVKATSVVLNTTDLSLKKGKTYTLKTTIAPANTTRKSVTFTSNNKKVATVSSKGVIKAIEQGSCVITAKNINGKYRNCKVTVTKPEYVDNVNLDKATVSLQNGDSVALSATITPSDAIHNQLTWKSSDSKVATVSNQGVVTYVSEGECTVTAIAEGGAKAECLVVTHPVVEINGDKLIVRNARKSYNRVMFAEGKASTIDEWNALETVKRYIAVDGETEVANFRDSSEYTFQFTGSEKTYYYILKMDSNIDYDPILSKIATVNIIGDTSKLTVDKNKIKVEIEYSDDNQSFVTYAEIKYQGSSSLNYPKKNYNISLFKDEECDSKNKVTLKNNWGKQNKYTLKANYVDASQARNLSGARIFADVLYWHADIDQRLKESPNNGVVEGYPSKLYVNGVYNGIYTINIPKGKWMTNLGDDGKQAIVSSNVYGDSSFMKSELQWKPTDADSSYWEVEESSDDFKDSEIKDSLMKVFDLAQTTSETEFKNKADSCIDVSMFIDYYLTTIFECAGDNLANNILWNTYDGKNWFVTMYDIDSCFGYTSAPFINQMYSPNYKIPAKNSMGYYTNNENILFDRILNYYFDDFKARYKQLRDNGIFSIENVNIAIGEIMDKIPTSLYEQEKILWPDIPAINMNQREDMINFMKERIKLVDQLFQYQ